PPDAPSAPPPAPPTPRPPAPPNPPAATTPRDQPKGTQPAAATNPPQDTKPPEPPPTPAAKPPKCDEVACMVTPDLPCCKKGGGDRPRDTTPTPSPAAANLPDRPDRPDIIAGMKAVTGRVQGCNDTYKVAGSFKIKVTVSPDGTVTNAAAQPPMQGTPTGACVEKAVKAARFKKTKNPITFSYPYNFR